MITGPMMPPIHLRHLSLAIPPQGAQQRIQFTNPNIDNYPANIEYAAKLHRDGVATIGAGMLTGKRVIVVGSGPSLKDRENQRAIRRLAKQGAVVMACKQAIKYLHDHNIPVAFGVTMDPGAHIARPEKIYKAPGVVHLVASSSDPLVFQYLTSGLSFGAWLKTLEIEDAKRVLEGDYDKWASGEYVPPDAGENTAKVLIYHSACGYQLETKLYKDLFDEEWCATGGYNVVNRAVAAAMFMGAEHITLAGTDCGWHPEDTFYADGTSNRPGVDMSDHGIVEGTDENGEKADNPNAREWMTRPDMLASGVALAKLSKRNPDMFAFVGDTLPAKLVNKSFAFLDKCASFAS